MLILKPCCLGDVLMATPLARALATAWPDARIDWAVDAHSRPALAGNPHVDGRLVDATGCVRGAYAPWAIARLAFAVVAGRYDVAFVPDRSPVLALVAWLGRIPRRVGLDSRLRGRLYTVRVPVPYERHEIELYLDLARAVGLPAGDARPVFVPSAADHRAAARVLAELPPDGRPVVVHPGGGENPGQTLLAKRWPPARFAGLVARLGAWSGARFVLVGGPGDREAARAVLAALPAEVAQAGGQTPFVLDAAGRLSFGETAALVAGCDLYIGNDTGATHLAAAVGAPVLAVFGPTDPGRYGPLPGIGVAVAPRSGAVDRLADAEGSRAIEGVGVDDVLTAARALLIARLFAPSRVDLWPTSES